ncbi:ECF RNA polymerase sigma factor SigW [Kordia antarctica]|uniref:ECF RNA polymerase sigma factor SigW n=1 Tax=Kordia antarctica TaxID=1218801 RepID=A0A7L4ZRN5_9FLAO|nr:sigma-70 family RNA polymerase sigma factor [Kordia antarctica]QHI39130.1 ECF RNA polymerase sigma factor SigW [Kordia antarctica]
MGFLNRLFLVTVNTTKNLLGSSKKFSDEDLVAQIVATNNTLLYSTLYDRYGKKVYNKCYSFARNEEEAKDLTQDVFLKLFIKLNTFKGTSKFSTWLYSFTYNFCVNYVNRDKARKMNDASDSMDNHDYYLSHMEDINEEELFELKVSKLETALDQIEPEDKSILLLKYQDDTSVKELQKILSIGESAVKMRLKRARIRIVEEYKKLEQ